MREIGTKTYCEIKPFNAEDYRILCDTVNAMTGNVIPLPKGTLTRFKSHEDANAHWDEAIAKRIVQCQHRT